jgi:hypothetical protein
MEKDRLIFLLRRVKHKITYYNTKSAGICHEITRLYYDGYASFDEVLFLATFLKNHKPNKSRFVEFTELPSWGGKSFWWKPIYEDRFTSTVRVNYLKALINKIKHKHT